MNEFPLLPVPFPLLKTISRMNLHSSLLLCNEVRVVVVNVGAARLILALELLLCSCQ